MFCPTEDDIEKFQEIFLEKERVSVSRVIDENEFLRTIKFGNVVRPSEQDTLVAHLVAYVWYEKLQNETEVVSEPRTWWDHLKIDHPWIRMIFRGKLKYKEIRVKFERKALFPRFAYHTDKHREKFVIHESVGVRE